MTSTLLRLALAILLAMQARPASAAELLVSAAISLREAFVEIGHEFEKEHRGDRIIFNFGASGELAEQIERGAPADIIASAALKEIQRLSKQVLLIEDSMRIFARNRLVIIVPENARKVSSLGQLAKLDRITIGNPETVPAGRYAAEALSKAGIYQSLLSGHKLIFAESVRQSLAYVEGANVDAGLVYSTDAKISNKVVVSLPVPANYTQPVVYPIAIVRDSKHVELGRSFVDFVLGKVAQQILLSKGFLPVGK